jgi:hypothetical protein
MLLSWRRTACRAGALGVVLAGSLAILAMMPTGAFAAGNAAYTTFDKTLEGCVNSSNGVNCNIYEAKKDVYINGGPSGGNGLANGEYFFAVLAPGCQNGGFLEEAKGNLSDMTAGTGGTGCSDEGAGEGDLVSNRTFTVNKGLISEYNGTHKTGTDPQGNFAIALFPYDNTPNPGGVYILAICPVGATKANSCKFDAFKVRESCTIECGGAGEPAAGLTVVKTAEPSFTRGFEWEIAKSVNKTLVDSNGSGATFSYAVTVTKSAPHDGGWQVTGTITVFNPNEVAVPQVSVTDAINDNHSTCGVEEGTDSGGNKVPASKGTIPADGTAEYPYTCIYSQAPEVSSETNTATATWPTETLLDLSRLAGGSATFNVEFTFGTGTAGNPTVSDNCVSVSDTFGGTLATSQCESTTFTYLHTFEGDPAGTCTTHENIAMFTTNTSGTTGSASQEVKVCVGADLTVSKTAEPSFTRTYNWNIEKKVDKTLVEQLGGGTATFNYTVKAAETGFTDSGWQVTGTITVSNPNDWEAVSLADVTDSINNGGNCPITSGEPTATVPESGSVTLGYTCTYASAPSPAAFTNTATATWEATAASTPDGSASGEATGEFGSPTKTGNKTIEVTDTFNGKTETLGTLVATDKEPFATATYKYSRTVSVPASNCVKYTNTAATGTGPTSSQTVEVCGPAKTGALTMGFWQNKNGQGNIQKYSGTNCQALRTWLNQFHPFSDLTATTCGSSPSLGATSATGVVGYVYNVIKAATCTSTSKTCNSMLKAQMLATALDVYFSDPGLGGNRIGATGPLGGVEIDLTKICHMIDGSGGTATCSGSYEDVSSAFGAAKKMTVMNMLLYQNTADPAVDAGAVWYGQVKATQVLAKDAFDAINNQLAFAP